jgi:hypothetical protein
MDYLQLASALVVIYAAAIPLYMAGRIFKVSKWFFIVSATLGLGLLVHGVYHYWAFLGNGLLKITFEFLSAILIFSLTAYYTYLRRVKHGN